MIDIEKTANNRLDLRDKTPRILKVDGTEVPFYPKNGKYFDYTEIQEALKGDGNNDPLFTMAGTYEDMLMVAEDNGLAMNLPLNRKASAFYQFVTRSKEIIVGNCLLMPKSMME